MPKARSTREKSPSPPHALDVLPGLSKSYAELVSALAQHQQDWLPIQQQYLADQFKLWAQFAQAGGTSKDAPVQETDKRFAAQEWQQYPLFDYLYRSYQLTGAALAKAVEAARVEEETKRRLRFFTKQYVEAMSPSNFLATNPEALKLALESGGASLSSGWQNLLDDMAKGRISMTDESAFEVGRNIAVTPGSVVFENELIQLIQYAPSTKTVYERPIVMVPPCINKFYIMDLQPDNSFVRYAVEQGHTVFMLSWRNVDESQQHLTWDDYLELGVLQAIEVAREISKAAKINVLGFCVGGTLLASALAVLKGRKQDWIASQTLMTALTEFSDVGEIAAFIDEHFIEQREKEFEQGGLMPGKELADAFSSLRPNDLIWNYVVGNYLKGQKPPAFDLLYWNSDSTNLPGPMYAYYLRHMYKNNELVQPNKLTMCDVKIDLQKVDWPSYVFAAAEDHIVPWQSAYRSARSLGGKVEFALGASGHIAGSMNSAYRNKRSFWHSGKFGDNPQAWRDSAQEQAGSWWPHWAAWLSKHSGKQIKAPAKAGSKKHAIIETAPGRYVKQRAA